MPRKFDISPEIEQQLRDFEQEYLSQTPEYQRQFGRSLEEAVTNKLMRLLGTGVSSSFRNRFLNNLGALQSGFDVWGLEQGRDIALPPTDFSQYLTSRVESGDPFIEANRAKGIFAGLPAILNAQTEPGGVTGFLATSTPERVFDIYAAATRPTASAYERFRRGAERESFIDQYADEYDAFAKLRNLQAKATGVDFAKYNQSVSAPYQNLGANYLETVQANNPEYYQQLQTAFQRQGGDINDLAGWTIGRVLAAQAQYWNSADGYSDPDQPKARAFVQQYGYWPSSLEAALNRPLLRPQGNPPPGVDRPFARI